MLCAALATRWGVEYTATHKHVWFRIDLPDRPVGTRSAGPVVPDRLLPLADSRVRVAVLQVDAGDCVSAWNEDAEHVFGYAAEKVVGRPLADRRSKPSSRTALMGEQPNPWDRLQPQDATSRHRGAKPSRRYGLLGKISLLSPGYLLSVERRRFHKPPPDH
ncbi:conserved hypothetical protein [Streptomyces sp. Mg1]|nr:conserved hypothetical protein [Streptomyces sp. Mg1]